jgi:GT2 family glycosyltransferase/glycosyltransferase involved in cell wall biosynthesis
MTAAPRISVVTVTFNACEFIEDCVKSILATNQSGVSLEVVVVDNGSTDGTVELLRERYPQLKLLQNDENNYARALNLGIANSEGEFVVISNNDATVHREWLHGFLEVFQTDEKIGAVQSKIYFAENQLINSVGVEEIEHFYYRDIGFEEEDSDRYATAAERKYVTGGSVMFRRACLEEVGPWDEDFIMFMEDVDYSVRCREKGWSLWYSPGSILYHQYHGSSSHDLCEYFCTRNRFLFVAKHYPLELASCIPSSHFFKKEEYDLLCRSLLHSVRTLYQCQSAETVNKVLQSLGKCLPGYIGEVSAYSFFTQLEVLLGLRKIRVGIYDHAGHFAGGGQRYVAEMAAIMQERYDVTYIFNRDVQLSDYKEWFDIDLSQSAVKLINIPFFDKKKTLTPNEHMVLTQNSNTFDVIARESLNYDIFVNANMLGKVNPLAPVSIFVCHFPDQERGRFFQVDKYDHLIINGDYTGEWVEKRWQLKPTKRIYPPINMFNPKSSSREKEKLILSVARFEVSGSKKQLELVQTFSEMCRRYPEKTAGWKLVLVGGSSAENYYLDKVEEAISNANCPIEAKPNSPVAEVRDLYQRAAVFWHACGLDETLPERVEHFGMTTVEAMQNYCVPIVIDGGGQREIVEHEESGFRFSTLEQLSDFSMSVIDDREHCQSMAERAFQRSQLFNHDVFRGNVDRLLDEVEVQLLGRDILPGAGTNVH